MKAILFLIANREHNVANSNDLFDAIEEKSKPAGITPKPMKELMDNWVNKKGYPIITVSRDYTAENVQIHQEYFSTVKPKETTEKENKEEEKVHWWVPINYATEEKIDFEETKATQWLEPEKNLTIEKLNSSQWLILNKQQTGTFNN